VLEVSASWCHTGRLWVLKDAPETSTSRS
jgi:hypothetical protein